jgi:hypothetical protein
MDAKGDRMKKRILFVTIDLDARFKVASYVDPSPREIFGDWRNREWTPMDAKGGRMGKWFLCVPVGIESRFFESKRPRPERLGKVA